MQIIFNNMPGFGAFSRHDESNIDDPHEHGCGDGADQKHVTHTHACLGLAGFGGWQLFLHEGLSKSLKNLNVCISGELQWAPTRDRADRKIRCSSKGLVKPPASWSARAKHDCETGI
jgi:hypothetical protein